MVTELIVDGIHLHPAIVQMILKLKGVEKMLLVTDAMRAKCLGDGTYDLGGQDVIVKEGVAMLADGTLAGSTLKMSAALQNIMRFTQCSLFDTLKMTSENPAKLLGIFDKKGSIAIQKSADLVVLDEHHNVCFNGVRWANSFIVKTKFISRSFLIFVFAASLFDIIVIAYFSRKPCQMNTITRRNSQVH